MTEPATGCDSSSFHMEPIYRRAPEIFPWRKIRIGLLRFVAFLIG